MLVLSRREGESIFLPGLDVRVVLVRASGGRARLGIEAPRNVKVLRNEIEEEPPKDRQAAQSGA